MSPATVGSSRALMVDEELPSEGATTENKDLMSPSENTANHDTEAALGEVLLGVGAGHAEHHYDGESVGRFRILSRTTASVALATMAVLALCGLAAWPGGGAPAQGPLPQPRAAPPTWAGEMARAVANEVEPQRVLEQPLEAGVDLASLAVPPPLATPAPVQPERSLVNGLVIPPPPATPLPPSRSLEIGQALPAEVSFDCNAGITNWKKAWSIWKKRWCCTNKQTGCFMALTGSCHVRNVQYSKIMDANNQLVHTAFDDAVKVGLNELANKPSSGSATTVYPVSIQLEEYASALGNVVVHFELTPPPEMALWLLFDRITDPKAATALLLVVQNVPNIGQISTESIYVSNCMIDKPTTKLPCSCDHGVTKNSVEGCPAEGGEKCKSCEVGYSLDNDKCSPNQCICMSKTQPAATTLTRAAAVVVGTGAEGPGCPKPTSVNFKFCSSCNQGYHLMMDAQSQEVSCEPNVCTCSTGVAVTGKMCFQDEAEICASCNPGYHVDENTVCQPNKCYCTNGLALLPGDKTCAVHNTEVCDSCNQYWHKSTPPSTSTACERNVCMCTGGTPAIGDNGIGCTVHGQEACVDCNGASFLHHDGTCGTKMCVCENGMPALGTDCVTNKGNICADCVIGFKLSNNKQCASDPNFSPDNCFCANGTPEKDQTNCLKAAPPPGALTVRAWLHAQSNECDVVAGPSGAAGAVGAVLTWNLKCPEPVGTLNVQPWRVSLIVPHRCAQCNVGYYRVAGGGGTSICQANVCTCTHGVAASGDLCLDNNLEVCANCTQGYHSTFDNDLNSGRLIVKCEVNVCRCGHGTPADTIAPDGHPNRYCHTHGEEVCKVCASGYGLNSKNVCEWKQCTCTNGVGAEGVHCFMQGTEDCGSCMGGFTLFADHPFRAIRSCRSDAALEKPFDCALDGGNSILGWSQLKKSWCCQHENIGCLASATQEEACTGHSLVQRACEDLGCCTFTSNLCLPKTRNLDMCNQGWALVTLASTAPISTGPVLQKAAVRRLAQVTTNPLWPNGLCLTAEEPYRNLGRTTVQPCNVHDKKMLWSLFVKENLLKNMLGHCASYDTATVDGKHEVRMVACDPASTDQMAHFSTTGSFTMGADQGFVCTEPTSKVGGKVTVETACPAAQQQFKMPSSAQVQGSAMQSNAQSVSSISGDFAVNDVVMVDHSGSGQWVFGVVQAVNPVTAGAPVTYQVLAGTLPYNYISESQLSNAVAGSFQPTWTVQYTDPNDATKKEAVTVLRRNPVADGVPGTYEIKLADGTTKTVAAASVRIVHSFAAGKTVLVELHGAWISGAKIQLLEPSGSYTVKYSDNSEQENVPAAQLSLADGFQPKQAVYYQGASTDPWDPKWTVVRKGGDLHYEIVNHEGVSKTVTDSKQLSMQGVGIFSPGSVVSVTGVTSQATVTRCFSDGSYGMMYNGNTQESLVAASKITTAMPPAPPAAVGAVAPAAKASCGDKDGAGGATSPVTDADCGAGFVYDSTKSTAQCAAATCVASVADRSTCCVAKASR